MLRNRKWQKKTSFVEIFSVWENMKILWKYKKSAIKWRTFRQNGKIIIKNQNI